MKKIAIIIICCFIRMIICAVPARPAPIDYVQEDGTIISVYIHGDEVFHYYSTSDNIPLVKSDNGSFCYGLIKGKALVSSNILAHNMESRTQSEQRFILENREGTIDFITKSNSEIREKVRLNTGQGEAATRAIGIRQSYIGQKKGLVILVNFADVGMTIENANYEFNRMFNEQGYSANNHIGSVHDYFYDQSYGKFDLTFDVVGPVTVSQNMSYYGKNDPITESDSNPREMVAEACRLADEYVDFCDYDWDGDGEVEQVFLIYAGFAESNGAPSNTIWPHKSALYGIEDNDLRLDGIRIFNYACSSELAETSGKRMNGIGTPCHEFSHCLGLPDFYDVNYNGGFGVDSYDLMDSGSHNGPDMNGEIPVGYSAYERWFAGWLEFTELDEMTRIKEVPSVQESPVAYKITNSNFPDEYFILENRQPERWFSFFKDYNAVGGLLIYHVDYSAKSWTSNSVNTAVRHQRMSIVPADGNYGKLHEGASSKRYYLTAEDMEGDFFPGSANIKEFTNTSHTNAGGMLFNVNVDGSYLLNKPITNIKEKDGMISFDFMGGIYVPKPYNLKVSDKDKDVFTLYWDSDASIDSFTVEASEIKKKSAIETNLISESFDKFKSTQTDMDGKFDLSRYIDSYTNKNGWKGKRIYTSVNGVKIGNDSLSGMLATPAFQSNSGSITVKLQLSAKAGTEKPLVVSLFNDKKESVYSKQVIGNETCDTIVLVVTDIAEGIYYLQCDCETPYYFSGIYIYDEEYGEDELSNSNGILSLVKPGQTIIVEDVNDNYYKFDNLKGNHYKVRVRACKDEAFSEWSDYLEVFLGEQDSVESLYEELSSPIHIYDLNGYLVDSCDKPGIYILDYGVCRKKIIIP